MGEEPAKNIQQSKTNYLDIKKIVKTLNNQNLNHLIYVSTCSNYGLNSKISF